MPSPTFGSCELLERYLAKRKVRGIHRWPKPISRLWENHRDGEVEFLEFGAITAFKVKKVRLRILAYRPGGLFFLKEDRLFANGRRFTPSMSTSVSEKRRFLANETVRECVVRALQEELRLSVEFPLSDFGERQSDKRKPQLRPSQSHPGLHTWIVKERFEWFMPPEHQRDAYVEECGYRRSDFTWVPPDQKIVSELTKRGIISSAA